MKALDNLISNNFIVNTGTIVLKNINEHCIKRQYEIFTRYQTKVKPVLRFRTMAPLGRYMGNEYSYECANPWPALHWRGPIGRGLTRAWLPDVPAG